MKHLAMVLTIALLPGSASAFMAKNDLMVRQRGDVIEVPYRGLSGASDFWCAAGDYVVRSLGRPRGTKVYRTSPPPRRRGEGITFSLSPEGAQDPGIAIFGGGPGISAGHAQELCDQFQHRFDR